VVYHSRLSLNNVLTIEDDSHRILDRQVTGMNREPIGEGPIIKSVSIHTVLVLLVWWSSVAQVPAPDFVVFEIELISPPAAELGEQSLTPPEDLVIETPEELSLSEEIEEAVLEEEDSPPEEDPVDEELNIQEEAVEQPMPVTGLEPDPEVESPGEDINVRMEGLRRDYPEYYNNIIRQIQRCFRWRGTEELRASIYFVINRDGSVSNVDVVESSRNTPFDIEAMGAAECAGTRDRLGPLPETLQFDQLPIVFKFDPKRGGQEESTEERKEL